ncbi:MAG: sodium:calcium antiporter, partial [Bacillota bacterium]|nr:sodium:calcium antiporter [Bacillota bacterium]
AAVGTALPETMIPIIAIFSGQEGSEEIGIGAILGAPFMLATLALGITGLAVIIFRNKRQSFPNLKVNKIVLKRDLSFFIIVYSVAILAAFIPSRSLKLVIAGLLVITYIVYLYLTFTQASGNNSFHALNPLYLLKFFTKRRPGLLSIIMQISLALGTIIFGATVFVDVIKELAKIFDIPTFILALIIAPVATELPEKFNSIIWVKGDKDTLALGNITGAMVFQSSLIPALGISMTSWSLTPAAFTSAVLALLSASLVYWQIVRKQYLTPYQLLPGIIFYLIFAFLIVKRIF